MFPSLGCPDTPRTRWSRRTKWKLEFRAIALLQRPVRMVWWDGKIYDDVLILSRF